MNGLMLKKDTMLQLNLFPLFLDYDFVNMRSRGVTCFIDFFSSGLLSRDLEEYSGSPVVFIRKSEYILQDGFFLLDYRRYSKDPEGFALLMSNMKATHIYMERSHHYRIHLNSDSNFKILEVDFYNE